MILGQHLIIECAGEHALLDGEALQVLMTRAADDAGAKVLYSYFHQFGGHGGITGVLVLAESHITVHTWPEQSYAAFDIFMCGDADPMIAADIIVAEFPKADVSIRSLDRGLPSAIKFVSTIKKVKPDTSKRVESNTNKKIEPSTRLTEILN